MKQLVIAGLVLITLHPVLGAQAQHPGAREQVFTPPAPPRPAPGPLGFTAEFHIYVEMEGKASQTAGSPAGSDIGFLDAVIKAREIYHANPDIRGKAVADLVCKGPDGRRRYYAWGTGGSLHEALDDAVRLAREDLKK